MNHAIMMKCWVAAYTYYVKCPAMRVQCNYGINT